MYELYKLMDSWYVKVLFAGITTLFSSSKVSLFILCLMIIIDTLTGSIYAFRIKKFSSKGFRKGLNKIAMYFLCILVVRLLEIGIEPIIKTTNLTDFIAGYLIITESFSALENLTLLGAPLPFGITKIIINNIKNATFKQILLEGINKKNYIEEISDMIQYSLPNIKDEKVKSIVEIKLNEWAKFINILDVELNEAENYSKDLLQYKVLALIEATIRKVCECWSAEDLSKEYMKGFMRVHKPRVDKYLIEVKAICESDVLIDKKKNQIVEKLIVVLYQTLTDIQKLQSSNELK